MRRWLAKIIYKDIFDKADDLKARNTGITKELKEVTREYKTVSSTFERFKYMATGREYLGTFIDKIGVEFYAFRHRQYMDRRIAISFILIENGHFFVAGNYLYSFVSETKIKIDDCPNESYKNRGHGNVFMKYLFEDIKQYGVNEVVGDLALEDGTEESKNRREYFYTKHGFKVTWDDENRTTGKIYSSFS